jgi:hypothetical protein
MNSKNRERDEIEILINNTCDSTIPRMMLASFFRKTFGFYPGIGMTNEEIENADLLLLKIESALESDKMTKEEFYKFYLGGPND